MMLNSKFYSSWTKNIKQVSFLPVNITNQIDELKTNELVNIQGIISLYLLVKPENSISNFFYRIIHDEFISERLADFIDSIQNFSIQKLNVVLKVIENKTLLI